MSHLRVKTASEFEVRYCMRSLSERMEDAEYTELPLKRLLPFKTLAKSNWEPMISGLYQPGVVVRWIWSWPQLLRSEE
jgi:hypothetical protein